VKLHRDPPQNGAVERVRPVSYAHRPNLFDGRRADDGGNGHHASRTRPGRRVLPVLAGQHEQRKGDDERPTRLP
jgi:hypothetical protein